MNNIKFIDPLFDTRYFKKLYKKQINQNLYSDLGHVINDWIIINLYNPINSVIETQTTFNNEWKMENWCMQQPVGSTTIYMDKTGNVIYDDLYNNVTIHSFDLDIANNKKYINTCTKYNFKYLWYSIHKGPHKLPMHVDKDSPIRYVQCISKETTHTDWCYNGNNLSLKEGDAFLFDPKFTHSIITEQDESVFLIADCVEYTVDEFNV